MASRKTPKSTEGKNAMEEENFARELYDYYKTFAPHVVGYSKSEIDDFASRQRNVLSFLPGMGASAASSVPIPSAASSVSIPSAATNLSKIPLYSLSDYYPRGIPESKRHEFEAPPPPFEAPPPSYEDSVEEAEEEAAFREMNQTVQQLDPMLQDPMMRDAPLLGAQSRNVPIRSPLAGQQESTIADLRRRRDDLQRQRDALRQ